MSDARWDMEYSMQDDYREEITSFCKRNGLDVPNMNGMMANNLKELLDKLKKALAEDEEEPEEIEDDEELWNADPNCKHNIVSARGGGVRCTKCGGWMCY